MISRRAFLGLSAAAIGAAYGGPRFGSWFTRASGVIVPEPEPLVAWQRETVFIEPKPERTYGTFIVTKVDATCITIDCRLESLPSAVDIFAKQTPDVFDRRLVGDLSLTPEAYGRRGWRIGDVITLSPPFFS